MKDKTKLTERQTNLYNLLMSNKDHWWTVDEIIAAVPGYIYHASCWDKCPEIREDKLFINSFVSESFKEVIVMKKRSFKIASYSDYLKERNAHISRLKNQIKEISDIDYKFGHKGYIIPSLFDSIDVVEE